MDPQEEMDQMGIFADLFEVKEQMPSIEDESKMRTRCVSDSVMIVDESKADKASAERAASFNGPLREKVLNTYCGSPRSKVKKIKWCLSNTDKDPYIQLSADKLTCHGARSGNRHGVRTNHGVVYEYGQKNRFYFEVKFTQAGNSRVGWSLKLANLDLGTCARGWGFNGSGRKTNNNVISNYFCGVPFGEQGDVVGFVIDLNSAGMFIAKREEDGDHYTVCAFTLKDADIEKPLYPTLCTYDASIQIKLSGDGEPAPFNSVWISEAPPSQIVANEIV